MDKLRAFLGSLLNFWKGLPTVKRVALIVVTLTVLVGVLVVAQLGNQVHYGTLYSELEPNDAGAIVEKLKAQQIPYKLEQNGTAIQVPEERVAALRLELASGGLPKGGGVGFEIFDRSQIGATEFEQQVSLRRALEGEISRSIMTIDGVKAARVHLVVPERRLFVSREETASASVVLSLRNSTEFGKKEVGSIVHLVAAAVPGLSRNRVSVVSSDGVTLHRPSDEGGGIDSESESEQGQNASSKMENDVRAQLERVVGAGQADVRVNVALDRESKERTEEHFEPTKNSLRSEHKVEESSGTAEAGVAGVPGALSNLPDTAEESAATATTTTAAGNLIRRVQTRNWEVDRVTQKTLTPRGGIRRVSVAVLLNGKYVKKGNKQVYVPRSKEELATLEAVVKSAVGFDEARGDVVHLANAEFSRIDDEAPAAPTPAPVWKSKWAPIAAGAVGGLFLLSLGVLALRRRSKKNKAEQDKLLALPDSALAAALPGAVADEVAGELASSPSTPGLPRASEDLTDLRAAALELANKDPASAAVVLRAWLHGEAAQAEAAAAQ
jgi:flagellar M-ring protein FliF